MCILYYLRRILASFSQCTVAWPIPDMACLGSFLANLCAGLAFYQINKSA